MNPGEAWRAVASEVSRRALRCAGWFVLGLLLSQAAAAQADASPFLQGENPLRSWLPTPETRIERAQSALERRLEQLLTRQPGVEHVAAVVRLPVVAQLPVDQPVPAARAVLVVRVKDRPANLDGLSDLARGVLPVGTELTVTRLDAALAPPADPPPLTRSVASGGRVGPFRVEERSAGTLRATLAGLLASNALMAGLLLWRRRRS